MINSIHIFGASGSGTTTLGDALSKKLVYTHFDTDTYFWEQTNPPFREKRIIELRQELLRKDLEKSNLWVLTGSLCGWGDFAIKYFDLAIYLYVPKKVRVKRLQDREIKRFGKDILDPNDLRYEVHQGFMKWAESYEAGGLDMRSKTMHQEWMNRLDCPIIRIEGISSLDTNLNKIISYINDIN